MKHLNGKIFAAAAAGLSLFGLVACGGSNPSSPVPGVVSGPVSGYGVPITNTPNPFCAPGTIVLNGSCTGSTDFSSACTNNGGILIQDAANNTLCKQVTGTGYFVIPGVLGIPSPQLQVGSNSRSGAATPFNVQKNDTINILVGKLANISISGNSDLMLGLNDQIIDAETTRSLVAKNSGTIYLGVSTPNTRARMEFEAEISHCQTATTTFVCP